MLEEKLKNTHVKQLLLNAIKEMGGPHLRKSNEEIRANKLSNALKLAFEW